MKEVNMFVFTASVNYANQALAELRDLDSGLKIAENPGNGVMIIAPFVSKEAFQERVVKEKTVFVRHIHAVDYIMDIRLDIEPQAFADVAALYKDQLKAQEKVAVQIRKGRGDYVHSPVEFKAAIDEALKNTLGIETEIKEPDKIISIFLNGNNAYIGLGSPQQNLSGWSGGMIHYKKDESDISRAKFKLMEAINIFHIDMTPIKTALDLGAAPGGWTSVLLEYGVHVTAVDTGDMDPRLSKYKNMHFIKKNVSELDLEGGSFDMLTSDISWNPFNTATMIKKTAQYLKSGGTAVVTLKLMGDKVRKTVKEITALYKDTFDILGARQLFHNRDEITIYMRKK